MAKIAKTKKAKKKSTKKRVQQARQPDEIIEASVAPSQQVVPQDAVTKYLSELRKYPLLTKEEEKQLAIEYYEYGDSEAAEKLVTSNLRFVVKIASEYSKFGAKMIDLIQEGNVGLMHGVREFNPYKGVRLITYAVWWIRGYIKEFLMKQYSLVRIGTTQNQRKLFYQLQKKRDELEKLGMESGIKQLSGSLEIPETEIIDMTNRMSGRDVSLDQPLGDNDSSTLIDLQSDQFQGLIDDDLGQLEEIELLKENIKKIRPSLSEKELYLLDHRLLADPPLTLQEVGDKYSVTREAIRQMESRLLKKIHKQMIE